jgi:hypothetical protein
MSDDAILGLVDESLARCPMEHRREGDRVRSELLYGDRTQAIRDLLIWRSKFEDA